MALTIEYCGTCNYRPLAASLAMSIKAATGLTSELVHSRDSGAFEVTLDGENLFSKKTTGQFPDHGEIVAAIRKRQDSPP
jgi:selT/selW/selH-like putative selenoprotein